MRDRITLSQLARELGTGRWKAKAWVRRHRTLCDPQGTPPTYDARALDVVRALRREEHRTIAPASRDWLAQYLGEPHDRTAASTSRPQEPGDRSSDDR